MKKLLSLSMIVLLSLAAVTAAAQAVEHFTIEVTFDGTEVEFEDGFSIMVPSDWSEYEVDTGVCYGSEDGSRAMQIVFIDGAYTFDEVSDMLIEVYGGASHITLNDIDWLTFMDEEFDTLAAAAKSADGYYMFTFSPASDADFVNLAEQIMATVKNT